MILTYSTFLLCLTAFCYGKLPKLNTPASPLDGPEKSDFDPDIWPHQPEFAAEPPPCDSACVRPVAQVLTIYFKAGSFKENMRQACRAYDEAVDCVQQLNHCGTDSMFDSLTSGLRYMCREQKDAFHALSDCIDANMLRVSQDCDTQCHPNSLATGLAVKDTVMSQLEHPLVSKNVNMRRIIEPHMSRFFFSQGCRIGQCLMACTKTKYNMICEGTAGSLLLEMLTRPLSAQSGSFATSSYLASVLGGLLPHQCSFLTAGGGARESFRIDPELDKEIKRMYSDKNRTKAGVLSSLDTPVEVEDPFLEMSNAFHRASPFDYSEDIDELLVSSGDVPEEVPLFEEGSGEADQPTDRTVQENDQHLREEPHVENHRDFMITTNDSEALVGNRVEAQKTYELHITRGNTGGELVCLIRD
ncbi:hypothetical protein Q1695_001979 [Nippostrongylus brasiliensis]|nr:hypothetical protein Q1695_001979 [Nippostrongylus brasiliensis]